MKEETETSLDKKAPINTGHGIVHFLKEKGVRRVFGIPDGHTLALYDGMLSVEGIDHVLCNDERTAAFAADAYARVTGQLAVCDAGAAGAMNFPVGISEAHGYGSPLLAIVGVVKTDDLLRNIPHDIKAEEVLRPITKWSERVLIPEQMPRFLKYAVRTAINGKPGPVALIIPEDILRNTSVPLEEFLPEEHVSTCTLNSCRTTPANNEIEVAMEMIIEAKQPVFFTGSRSLISDAGDEIDKLARLLHAPIFTTISGKGIVAEDHPYHFGTIGLFGEKPNHKFLRKSADLIVVVGNRLTEDDTANFKVPPSRTKMIHIDVDAREIGLSFSAWGVVGDCKAALGTIYEGLSQSMQSAPNEEILKERDENLAKLKDWREKYHQKDQATWMNAEPIKPQRVLYSLRKAMSPKDYLVTDASASSRWIGVYFPIAEPGNRIIAPRGVGPTGFGLGALLGTSIAVKDEYPTNTPEVVLLTGDGGIMNAGISDIETLVQRDLKCTIIIINNQALGFVKFGQAMLQKQRYYDTDRRKTPFKQLAEAFGAKGYEISTLSELDSQLTQIIKNPGVKIIDIQVDPEELLPPNHY